MCDPSKQNKFPSDTVWWIGTGSMKGWRVTKECKESLNEGNEQEQVMGHTPKHMNIVECSEAAKLSPKVEHLAPGTIFRFPEGNAFYIRTDLRRPEQAGCVHLGSGALYWIGVDRLTAPCKPREIIRLTVNTL